uniref:Uncharacterized protein n=1 Tax=Rhizophora mucronata TaxID=61149 RepID=A0A2P2ILP8_RHIMU
MMPMFLHDSLNLQNVRGKYVLHAIKMMVHAFGLN